MCIEHTLKKYNLSAAEQPFFMALMDNEGITQEELTAIVCVDKSAAARTLKSLEEKGYVIREQDKKDKRQNRVYLTQMANEISDKVSSELLNLNDMIVKNVTLEEINVIYKGLSKINDNVIDILNNK
jgi:DNA-binding MarR family transcriptional regulator